MNCFNTNNNLRNRIEILEKENNDIKHHTNILVDSLLATVQVLETNLENAKKGYTQKNVKNIIYELYETSPLNYECIICLDNIEKNSLKFTDCGHYYCNKCYNTLEECSSCKRKFK